MNDNNFTIFIKTGDSENNNRRSTNNSNRERNYKYSK